MKRVILIIVLTVSVSISVNASAQTRVDIMNFVIWPCISSVGTAPYELSADEEHVANFMVFMLHRDYFERVITMVEAAFSQEYPKVNRSEIYGAGFVVCALYHPEPRRIE